MTPSNGSFTDYGRNGNPRVLSGETFGSVDSHEPTQSFVGWTTGTFFDLCFTRVKQKSFHWCTIFLKITLFECWVLRYGWLIQNVFPSPLFLKRSVVYDFLRSSLREALTSFFQNFVFSLPSSTFESRCVSLLLTSFTFIILFIFFVKGIKISQILH